jgi:hypothetical protein
MRPNGESFPARVNTVPADRASDGITATAAHAWRDAGPRRSPRTWTVPSARTNVEGEHPEGRGFFALPAENATKTAFRDIAPDFATHAPPSRKTDGGSRPPGHGAGERAATRRESTRP